MGGRWPYSWCLVGCCRQDLFNIARSILCNCRLASSPAILLSSMYCIHTAVSIRPLPGRNCVLFYRSGLISIWSKAYWWLSMPSLAACRLLFRLMRRCFLGRWVCLLVLESFFLVWRCLLFDYSTHIPFCVHCDGGQCLQRLVPNYAVVFRLGWVYFASIAMSSV